MHDQGRHVVVLDQSFRSQKLIEFYAHNRLIHSILHFVKTVPQLSLLLEDYPEILLTSLKGHEKPYIPKRMRNDLKFMREAVKINSKVFELYESARDDKEAAMNAVKQDGNLLKFASNVLHQDFDVVLQAFIQNPKATQQTCWQIQTILAATSEYQEWRDTQLQKRSTFNREFRKELTEKIRTNPMEIKSFIDGFESRYYKEKLVENAEIMLECINVDPSVFPFAHKNLRSNKEFVMESLGVNGNLLAYVDESLVDDLDVIKQALRQTIYAVKFLKEEMKTEELLLEFPDIVEYYDANVRSKRGLMMEVVKRNGKLLKFVDKSLQSDREMVLLAVRQDGMSIQHADPIFYGDREVAMGAIQQNGNTIGYFHKKFGNDQPIVEKSIETNGLNLRFASISIRKDRGIVLKAVSNNGISLKYASKDLQKDRDIIMTALKKNGSSFEFAHSSLWNDIELIQFAGKYTFRPLFYAKEKLKSNKDIVFPILCKFTDSFEYIGECLKNDWQFLLSVIENNYEIFGKLSNELKQDEEFVRRAIAMNGYCYVHLDSKFKNNSDLAIIACNRMDFHLPDFLIANREYRKDVNFIEECVKRNGMALNHFNLDVLDEASSLEIAKLAIKSI